ncbi:hypothetical protein KCP74_20490 [Salmonella enterica subsp. enterica]|nr:hypothetical protein KCP74_20490 [Salmonella enterica subsp. enterica]
MQYERLQQLAGYCRRSEITYWARRLIGEMLISPPNGPLWIYPGDPAI